MASTTKRPTSRQKKTALQSVAELIPGIAWIARADGETDYINQRGMDYGGLDAVQPPDWIGMVHPQEARGTRAAWRRAVQKSDRFHLECRLRRHDGLYRWHVCNAGPVSGARGNVTHWLASATDIDELKRHDSQVRHGTETRQGGDAAAQAFGLLTTLEESAPIGLGYVDLSFNIVRANKHFLALSGLPAARQVGRALPEILDDLWPQISDSLHDVLKHEKPALNREASRIDDATGRARHWLFSFFPVLVGKAVIGIGLVAMDISERKHAEMHLREREQQFRGIVEQSIAGTYILQDGHLAYVNRRFAEIFGYTAEQLQGLDPLTLVTEAERPRALEIIRMRMSGEAETRNYEFTAIRADGSNFDLGVHGSCASHRGRPAIIGLVQDISGKKRIESDRQEYVMRLESALMRSVEVAMTLSEMRDPYTAGHERRVADIAVSLGRMLGMDDKQLQGLRVAGYLHDMGKITVPVEILSKSGRLSPAEFMLIKGHPQAGHDVLKNVEFPWPVATIILQHHERLDGSGYPDGIRDADILPEARILAIADVVEAMSSHRPYRPSLGIDKALAEIEQGGGRIYDADVSQTCLRLFRDKENLVMLGHDRPR